MTLPRETARSRVDATLGMVFFIGSWSMAFGTLFLSFGILRTRVGVWPPPGIHLPSLPMAAVGTVVLLASSLVLHRAVKQGRAGHAGFVRTWGLAMLLGLAFAGLQAGLWFDLLANGRHPESGVYESLFYGLTWVHAAHVVTGLLALLWMLVGILRGRYGSHRMAAVQNAALFWHFVDAVWVILFVAFFFT
jgi:heme/copper-type cytochrome/quinol oxidase subunit 3